jgi:hypothetical protein
MESERTAPESFVPKRIESKDLPALNNHLSSIINGRVTRDNGHVWIWRRWTDNRLRGKPGGDGQNAERERGEQEHFFGHSFHDFILHGFVFLLIIAKSSDPFRSEVQLLR